MKDFGQWSFVYNLKDFSLLQVLNLRQLDQQTRAQLFKALLAYGAC